MFSNVFLTGRLATGFLKAAVQSQQVRLAEPQNEYEAKQIRDFKTELNGTRSDRRALYYGLMFDRVFLNNHACWGNCLLSDEKYNAEYRSLIDSWTPEVSEFVSVSSTAGQIPQLSDASARERANLFGMYEPLIWQRWKRSGPYRITRPLLRDVLDFIVMKPSLAEAIHDCRTFEQRSLASWRRDLEPLNSKYLLDENALRFFFSTISITWMIGFTAALNVGAAQKLDAAFPVVDLSFAKGRSVHSRGQLDAIKDESLIAGVRLFLDEIDHSPVVESFNDVLRLRANKDFSRFRSTLNQWVTAISAGDIKGEEIIRSELRRSNAALRRAATCQAVGRYFVYVGLPLIVLDALTLPLFGASLSVTGFGVQAYADWQRKKHRWLMIGNG